CAECVDEGQRGFLLGGRGGVRGQSPPAGYLLVPVAGGRGPASEGGFASAVAALGPRLGGVPVAVAPRGEAERQPVSHASCGDSVRTGVRHPLAVDEVTLRLPTGQVLDSMANVREGPTGGEEILEHERKMPS